MAEGVDFKREGPHPVLGEVMDEIKKRPVIVDWYPRLAALAAKELGDHGAAAEKKQGKLSERHLAFMDFDAIWFELHRLKNERSWFNFDLPREAPRALLEDGGWYTLYIPEEELAFTVFERFKRWQEIAVALLTKYCDRYYKACQAAYENDHLEYRILDPADKKEKQNLVEEYRLLVASSEAHVLAQLEGLKDVLTSEGAWRLKFAGSDVSGNLRMFGFDRHIYEPLVAASGAGIEVKPVSLNKGERDFVLGLRTFCEKNPKFFEDKELYLLRNKSRVGIGFFQKENFYPDFLLWLIVGGKQYVTFIEPHGIRMDNPDDPKYLFATTIKDLQAKLADPDIVLNSFVLSVTPYSQSGGWFAAHSRDELEKRHVLFLGEDNAAVSQRIIELSLA